MLYELLYILSAKLTDEEAGGVEGKVNALLVKYGANVESVKRLGKFRLAYHIRQEHFGHYVLTYFSAEPSALAKIEENLRIANDVIRYLVIRADEAGADQKFNLVQFTEVTVESKEDRARRRDRRDAKPKEADSVKEGVAVLEAASKQEDAESAPVASAVSAEELDKKIETALSEDVENL